MTTFQSDVDLSPAIRSMSRQLNMWAIVSIAWGLLRLFVGHPLDTGFPLALVFLGMATFYVRAPAMLVLFAVAYCWTGLLNVLEFSPWWTGLGLVQLVAGIHLFRQYRLYSHIREHHVVEYFALQTPSVRIVPVVAKFPLLSAALGTAASFELAVWAALAVVVISRSLQYYVAHAETLDAPLPYEGLTYLIEPLAVFGFALGLSSRLAGLPRPRLAMLGMTCGGSVMFAMLVLMVVAALSILLIR